MNVPLPSTDRLLLRVAATIVPLAERMDWLRCWEAELWHRRNPRPGRSEASFDLYPGLLRDSVWLRMNRWQSVLSGTAFLCLLWLGLALLVSLFPLWTFLGSVHGLLLFASNGVLLFCCEATLVTLVSFATCSRLVEYKTAARRQSRLASQFFQAAKILLVLLTAFVLSEGITQPFHASYRFIAEVVQPQIFVLLALVALRWSFQDQENRCKHCLRSLSAPARVGRPSWNFLDSNGTELLCRDGHGLLSVPEIETSWRRSSHWIAT